MAVVLDQPFQILLELVQAHKLDPWDVDIEKLADVFIQRINEMQELDLRLSGRAIFSASILLRMKSEYMFNGNGNGSGLELEEEDLGGFDLNLPDLGSITVVQRAPRKITIFDIMGALQEALREMPAQRRTIRRDMEKIMKHLSEYHINLDRYIDELYQKILNLASAGEDVVFSKLIPERTRLAASRTLLLLLFLSARGKIILDQNEPFGEIFVKLKEG
jgi:segregation and condensation protein A